MGIYPKSGVTRAEETLVVKGLARGLRVAPVARCDVGAAVAHLGLAVHGHQLQFQARRRHADVAGLHVGAVDSQRERRRLGHAQAGVHHNALTQFALGAFKQRIPHRLRQGGGREEEHLHPAQQVLAQHLIGFHEVGDDLETGGHVEVQRGRDLPQVADGLGHGGRGRLALVDVERAAVVDRQAEVVVAAEGVVPGQPVHQHGRPVIQRRHGLAHLLLVGAPHAVRIDHGLGHLGGARGEEEFGDGARAGGLHRGVYGWGGLCGQQVAEQHPTRSH